MLVWAREDRLFPLDYARRMVEILPHGRLALIDDSYTFVSEDQRERLAAAIKEFASA